LATWKHGGYIIRMYANDHPPLHVHIFRDGKQLDRWDIEHQQWMDGTIGGHHGRALEALRACGLAT
jgi:hypothetical protein